MESRKTTSTLEISNKKLLGTRELRRKKERNFSGYSKHTQFDLRGHPVGSNTKKGKRAY